MSWYSLKTGRRWVRIRELAPGDASAVGNDPEVEIIMFAPAIAGGIDKQVCFRVEGEDIGP